MHGCNSKSTHSGSDATSVQERGDNLGEVASTAKAQSILESAVPKEVSKLAEKQCRLVAWNFEVLTKLLRTIVARREAVGFQPDSPELIEKLERRLLHNGVRALDEVKEVVFLPKYDDTKRQVDEKSVELNDIVTSQLQEYLQTIAQMYHSNPFHNFEHVSHGM